jgi:hypothetical protein
MGRGQASKDLFAGVLGRGRGRGGGRGLAALALTDESRSAIEDLVCQAQGGDLVGALSQLHAQGAHRLSSPVQDEAFSRLAEALLPQGWAEASTAWAVALIPEGELPGLQARVRGQAIETVRQCACECSPRLGPVLAKVAEKLPEALLEDAYEAHMLCAAESLASDPSRGQAPMCEILGLAPGSASTGDEGSEVPLAPLSAADWASVLRARSPRAPFLAPPSGDVRAGVRMKLRRLLLDMCGAPPPGSFPGDQSPPGVAVANLVRARMEAMGLTGEDVMRRTGCSQALVTKMTIRTTRGRGGAGGARASSLAGVATFCDTLGMSPHVVYLCGLANELSGIKRKGDGALREPRRGDARCALAALAGRGISLMALQEMSGYVEGPGWVHEGSTSHWWPFQELIAWESARLELMPTG